MEAVASQPEIQICFMWRVRYKVKKRKLKNNQKIYLQSLTELATGPDLYFKVQEVCKRRKHELVEIISHQAINVSFAYWKGQSDNAFLSREEQNAIPLPNQGKEIPYIKPSYIVYK